MHKQIFLVFYLRKWYITAKITSRKERIVFISPEKHPDSLTYWVQKYREFAVDSVRSEAVEKKITLHLNRFLSFFKDIYGHDCISTEEYEK